jgi:transposase-like protein
MTKTSIAKEVSQEGSLREGLETAIRERVREIIEMVLQEEVAAALERQWPGVAHQRCTVHKMRNLLAKAPKHTHEAVREEYHRMVYAENLAAAQKARETFLSKWKKQCPGVAASLEEAGENLLTFYRFPQSQWLASNSEHIGSQYASVRVSGF